MRRDGEKWAARVVAGLHEETFAVERRCWNDAAKRAGRARAGRQVRGNGGAGIEEAAAGAARRISVIQHAELGDCLVAT